ncbi:MAG: hypothetical protein SFV81_22490 [Pirellulaceae bacterium]|nr:hypothetical protein [Pirellulaceae bacterium]
MPKPLELTLNPINLQPTNNVFVSTIITNGPWPTKVALAMVGTNDPGFLNYVGARGFGADVANIKCVTVKLGDRKILSTYTFLNGILEIYFVAAWKQNDGIPLGVIKADALTTNLVVTVETEPIDSYAGEIENIEISISDGVIDP